MHTTHLMYLLGKIAERIGHKQFRDSKCRQQRVVFGISIASHTRLRAIFRMRNRQQSQQMELSECVSIKMQS